MISIIVMKNKRLKKAIKFILVLTFWLAVWETASLLVRDELKLFLPSPIAVFTKWLEIGFTAEYLTDAGVTLLRIFGGFALGSFGGIVLGIITTSSRILNSLISPVLKIVRAVPVVSFIILAFLFIHVDALPVFISFLMVTPLMWQTVHNGIENSDKSLDEMCRVYKIGKTKSFFKVKLPQCIPEIITAGVNALGLAWKSGVAAEVLCTPNISLGHRIYSAKASLSYDEVYSVTLTVVLLSIVIELLLKSICKKYLSNGGKQND